MAWSNWGFSPLSSRHSFDPCDEVLERLRVPGVGMEIAILEVLFKYKITDANLIKSITSEVYTTLMRTAMGIEDER